MGVWGPSTAASSGHGRGTQIGSAREQSSSPPRSAHGRPPPPHKPLNGAAMHVLSNSACCLLLPAVGGGSFLPLPSASAVCLSACLLPLPACCVCVCGGRVLFCWLPVCLPAVCLPAAPARLRACVRARVCRCAAGGGVFSAVCSAPPCRAVPCARVSAGVLLGEGSFLLSACGCLLHRPALACGAGGEGFFSAASLQQVTGRAGG